MDLSEVIDAYVLECDELLRDMENILLEMEKKTPTDDDLNALFRSVHTIKGTSGMFGFDHTVKFTHVVENLLDDLREGKLTFSTDLTNILLKAKDHIDYLVEAEPKNNVSQERIDIGKEISRAIEPYLNKTSDASLQGPESTLEDSLEIKSPPLPSSQNFLISFRPKRVVFHAGLDPFSFIVYLKKLGRITFLRTISTQFPTLVDYNPEECYLGFEIALQTEAELEKIHKVFDFIENDAFIHILPPGSSIDDLVNLARQLPEEEIYLGNLWVEMGILTSESLVTYLRAISGEAVSNNSPEHTKESLAASADLPLASAKQESIAKHSTLKVDAKRVDTLINRVGELVVASANLNQLVTGKNDSNLQESAFLVSRLLNEVREISLKLRMVPIGEVLQKYQRTVRDLSHELSKEIVLHIEGKETELDRNIVDKLGDPLVHIIRNACDHGMELPDVREKKGKPRQGNIWISAFHDTGSIVIEIRDDGAGIQTDVVWRKALEKGLVTGAKPENEEEIYKLLFHPGFSTAKVLTNVSGRGVGLDVVHKSIESLRGTIQVQSELDKGSSFLLRLPLTLAIIEGFLVSVGSHFYILPMDLVLECIEFNLKPTDDKNQYFPLRGSMIPYIRMKDMFLTDHDSGETRENIMIVRMGDKKAGVVVEQLYGEFQTVIKPMGSLFRNVKGVSGSTILADGKVALIIDLPSLFEQTISLEKEKII